MIMNNLITLAEALWQSGIAPALLILLIGWLSARFARTKRITALLGITDYLMKADKAHLFTAEQIDDASNGLSKR